MNVPNSSIKFLRSINTYITEKEIAVYDTSQWKGGGSRRAYALKKKKKKPKTDAEMINIHRPRFPLLGRPVIFHQFTVIYEKPGAIARPRDISQRNISRHRDDFFLHCTGIVLERRVLGQEDRHEP